MATKATPSAVCPMPIYTTLSERLAAGRDAADQAWASKASAGWRDTVTTLAGMVKAFELRAPEVASAEDFTRLRNELSEMLRSAASAIAPRIN